ncbi:MAG: diacylglycerol/lipid kinase family protein [Planctomycetota bacterium]
MRPRFSNITIICNPIAGRGRARASGESLAAHLRSTGAACELHLTTGRGDGFEHARRRTGDSTRPPDCFVAIGGDGTVREVLAGVGDAKVPVAILPSGTANVMSLDLGLPRDAAGAARMIADGHTHALDTALVNGELSFLVTGVGFDADVVRAFEAKRRGPITKASWVMPALRSWLGYRAPSLHVELDGRAWSEPVHWLLASNVVHYGGLRVLARDRRIDDGELDVYLVRAPSRFALSLRLVRALARGWPASGVQRVRAARIRVRADGAVPYQVDGDARGSTPVEIDVQPRSHVLVVPAPR